MTNQHTSTLTRERAIAVTLLSRGHCTIAEVARALGVSARLVKYWADQDLSAIYSSGIAVYK